MLTFEELIIWPHSLQPRHYIYYLTYIPVCWSGDAPTPLIPVPRWPFMMTLIHFVERYILIRSLIRCLFSTRPCDLTFICRIGIEQWPILILTVSGHSLINHCPFWPMLFDIGDIPDGDKFDKFDPDSLIIIRQSVIQYCWRLTGGKSFPFCWCYSTSDDLLFRSPRRPRRRQMMSDVDFPITGGWWLPFYLIVIVTPVDRWLEGDIYPRYIVTVPTGIIRPVI